jgi:putative ABC transport system permease protein
VLAERLYRASLSLLPADVRAEFADDMVQLYRDQRAEAPGHLARIALWWAAVWDVVNQALTNHSNHSFTYSPIHLFTDFSARSAMRAWVFDIRHGFRLLRAKPGSSMIAIAIVALAVGANGAIFSVVDSVLLRALPYPNPDRLAILNESRPKEGSINPVSTADFLDWRTMNTSFSHMAAYTPTTVSVTGGGAPERVEAGVVSPLFFDVLGVLPSLGRTFRADEEVLGQHRVVIITDGLWRRRYGADPGIINKSITVNTAEFQVAGVLPPAFTWSDAKIEMFFTLVVRGLPQAPSRASHGLEVYARLKPGVTVAQSRDEMDRIGNTLAATYPNESRGHTATVFPMQERLVTSSKTSLLVLSGAVGFVLLLACVNVAGVLASRAVSRQRELAVRAALGAGRLRLLTQTLAESLAISIVGGALGLGVAVLIMRGLPFVLPQQMSIVDLNALRIDPRMLLFTMGVMLVTTVISGVWPAFQSSRTPAREAMGDGMRTSGGVRRRARIALVTSEVALAALLLVGAGLALRSFVALVSQPIGFETGQRLTAFVNLGSAKYQAPEVRQLTMAQIEDRLRAIPGVTTVGAINQLPLGGGNSRNGVTIENREPVRDSPTRMHPRYVTPSYFASLAIPIVEGRSFTPADDGRAEPVAILSQTAVKQFWPNGPSPIGTRVGINGNPTVMRTIIGIAAEVRHAGPSAPAITEIYVPYAQSPGSFLTFVIKTDRDPAELGANVRAAVSAVDPDLALGAIETMRFFESRAVRSERALTVLMGAFAVVALLLAIVGIYGVMAELVQARTREVGVRMSLGAKPRDVLLLFLREGAWQAVGGLVVGLAAGVGLVKFLVSRVTVASGPVLFETRAWDPITLIGVSALLLAAALAACLIPARRAARIDPIAALRN